MLALVVNILKKKINPLTLNKVRAHINILRNERSNTLAEVGSQQPYRHLQINYKNAHSKPLYLHKDD